MSRWRPAKRGPNFGQIPQEAAAKIRRDARFDLEKVNEYIANTHHDVTAFLRSVQESLGEEGRYVHFGLTSSDVWDTATGLQLRDAADLLLPASTGSPWFSNGKRWRTETRSASGGPTACTPSPRPLGSSWRFGLTRCDATGCASKRLERPSPSVQSAGRSGRMRRCHPHSKRLSARSSGWASKPLTQVIQRDRHAQFVTTLAIMGASLEKFATGDPRPPKDRGTRGRRAVRRRPDRLELHAAQAQPGALRARRRARPRPPRLRRHLDGEHRALARARYLPLIDRAHRLPRCHARASTTPCTFSRASWTA